MSIELKLGAGRYTVGQGVLVQCGFEASRFGKKAFIIGGKRALQAAFDVLAKSLKESNMEYTVYNFYTQPCDRDINLALEQVKEYGADVVIGVGGGRCMDFSKAVSARASLPVITVPTIAATCAAWSPMSVIYDPDGRIVRTDHHPDEVQAVLLDYDVVVNAPARYLASGIADSLAKYPELSHDRSSIILGDVSMEHYLSYKIASASSEVLLATATGAYSDLMENKLTPAVSSCIAVILPLTGVVSGFAQGSLQLAFAHDYYEFVRNRFNREAADKIHGEIVAVGVLIQMQFNRFPQDEIEKVRAVLKNMDVPCCFSQLGIAPTIDNRDIIVSEFMRKYAEQNHTAEYWQRLQYAVDSVLS